MDGWAVIEQLKDNLDTRHIPVHILSASESARNAFRKGAIGYLIKPATEENTTEQVADWRGTIVGLNRTAPSSGPDDYFQGMDQTGTRYGIDSTDPAIRQQISLAIQIIVQQQRLRDGNRKITSVTEIMGMEGDQVATQELFRLEDGRLQDTGKVLQAIDKLSFTMGGDLPSLPILERSLDGHKPAEVA